MAEKLSWTELRRALASRAGVSEKSAGAFLNSFNAQLIEALKTEKQVKVNGLGTFKLQAVAARKSVNVKTGEEITIPGYNKIVFAPEAGVKELVESNGERRMANGERPMEKGEGIENDPLKKLGVQAAEIVDILGELGQSPNAEANGERLEAKGEEPVVEPEPVIEPEPVVEIEPVVEPIVEPVKEEPQPEEPKKKKKHHFWRDTLICVVCLLIVLVIAFFFFRSEISSWIKSFVEENKTEIVVPAEEQETPVTVTEEVTETPEVVQEPEVVIEPQVEPETAVEPDLSRYKGLIKTEEITEGSRLAWIAKKYYGNQAYWPYLYDANKDRIDNPSKITIGTPIRVPKLTKAQKDTTTVEFQELKKIAEEAIR